jgi:DNA (cytosine-5)-methyltransferase 1
MKYLSLFSGIGGFELGIQQAYENIQSRQHLSKRRTGGSDSGRLGSESNDSLRQERGNSEYATCIGYSEIDKYAIQVYNKQFNHKNYGDITTIEPKELPDFDCLVGGFPCQSFSIAGKRKGFEDTRGTLFFDIARILRDKTPRLVVLENVKGLLSHDKGATFQTILGVLADLGYDCQWQVLNSKNFGVPQNRERVFIVGHLRGTSRPKVFPIRESTTETNQTNFIDGHGETKVATAIDANYHKGHGQRGNSRGRTLVQLNKPKHSNDRVYSDKGISPTLNTMQGGNRQPFIKDEVKIRRLTPKECERLQGFPDGWTAKGINEKEEVDISDTQRYKMCGNAVTTNVIKEIFNKLDI